MSRQLPYTVTTTDSGEWLTSFGSIQLISFLSNDFSPSSKSKVIQGFKAALEISSAIPKAIQTIRGAEIINGLLLGDASDVTRAMNSIDGMAQTGVEQRFVTGTGSADSISMQLATKLLKGLGDLSSIEPILIPKTKELETGVTQETRTSTYGVVIGYVTLMQSLDIPVTSFQYIYAKSDIRKRFSKRGHGGAITYTYDFNYTIVKYNYTKPS